MLALDDANPQAVQRIEAWLETSIAAHQTVGVETVLSTPKYRRLVEKAKTLGFEIRLIYVLLDSPQRNVERVRLRVKKGGHAVPEDKILQRYTRSLEQLPWFLEQVGPGVILRQFRRRAAADRREARRRRDARRTCAARRCRGGEQDQVGMTSTGGQGAATRSPRSARESSAPRPAWPPRRPGPR